MDRRILFLGPVGAGKTTAVRTISDIDTVDTDVRATDDVRGLKATTTVAMDMGVMALGDGDRVVLYGAPGQERFDFMWDILLEQCDAVLLLLNHAAADPLADLDRYRSALLRPGVRRRPVVVGLTHVDQPGPVDLALYDAHLRPARERCGCPACTPPVQPMDARSRADVRAVLVTLAALLEAHQRLPARACAA